MNLKIESVYGKKYYARIVGYRPLVWISYIAMVQIFFKFEAQGSLSGELIKILNFSNIRWFGTISASSCKNIFFSILTLLLNSRFKLPAAMHSLNTKSLSWYLIRMPAPHYHLYSRVLHLVKRVEEWWNILGTKS